MNGVKGKALLGKGAYGAEPVYLFIRNGGNIRCIAGPRWGKGALCKNGVVQISKFKKVCIFDYKGEWAAQVTTENGMSDYPDAVHNFFVADNFTFSISDFDSVGDWIGLGFGEKSASVLASIIQSPAHKGDLNIIQQMIRDIPQGKDNLDYFADYGIDSTLGEHEKVKQAIGSRFDAVKHYFWQGKSDQRQLLNFNELWETYDHLIVDLSDKTIGFDNKHKARAFAGVILKKMRRNFTSTQGFYVFEEASQLLGNPQILANGQNEGTSELHNLVMELLTLQPKWGVNVLVLAQSSNQLWPPLLAYFPIFLVGRLNSFDKLTPMEQNFNEEIKDRREWILWDDSLRKKIKFVADVPVCLYETNM